MLSLGRRITDRSRKFSHGHPIIATFSLGTSVQQCTIARHSYPRSDNYRSEGRRRFLDGTYRRGNGKVMSKSGRGKFRETPTPLKRHNRCNILSSHPPKKGKTKMTRLRHVNWCHIAVRLCTTRKHEWSMNEVHAADFPAISDDVDARNLSPRKPRPKSRRKRAELHAIPSRVQWIEKVRIIMANVCVVSLISSWHCLIIM